METSPKTTTSAAIEPQPCPKPRSDLSTPAGFAASSSIQSEGQEMGQAALSEMASTAIQDPLLLRRLSDRVYELMLEDLRYQQERSRNYRSRFNA